MPAQFHTRPSAFAFWGLRFWLGPAVLDPHVFVVRASSVGQEKLYVPPAPILCAEPTSGVRGRVKNCTAWSVRDPNPVWVLRVIVPPAGGYTSGVYMARPEAHPLLALHTFVPTSLWRGE